MEEDGANYDGFAMKFDRNLNLLFARRFDHKGAQDWLTSVTVSPSGSEYWIAGYTARNDLTANGMDGLTIRLDKSGAVISTFAYGGAGNDMLMDIRPAFDGGYLLAGLVPEEGRQFDGWVLRVDDEGAIAFNSASGMALTKLDYPAASMAFELPRLGCVNSGPAGGALFEGNAAATQLVAPVRSIVQAP